MLMPNTLSRERMVDSVCTVRKLLCLILKDSTKARKRCGAIRLSGVSTGHSTTYEQPKWEGLNPARATTQISEHIAAEPRSTEMYEASTEGWKAVQVRIRITVRRSCQGIWLGERKELR